MHLPWIAQDRSSLTRAAREGKMTLLRKVPDFPLRPKFARRPSQDRLVECHQQSRKLAWYDLTQSHCNLGSNQLLAQQMQTKSQF